MEIFMNKYSLGLDFGTGSARAVLADVCSGAIIASCEAEYPSGVIDKTFFGKKLPDGYALQNPADYLSCMEQTIKAVLKDSGVNKEDIIGIGVDFTSSTILPLDENGTPLCFLPEFRENPEAYVKLWKHHSPQKETDLINEFAKDSNAQFIKSYGGKISCEAMLPKIMETINNDENVYNRAHSFIEAGDFITRLLTGKTDRSACAAGFKAFWEKGYPLSFFKNVDKRLSVISDKLDGNVVLPYKKIGNLTGEMAQRLGLSEETAVGSFIIDAHAALPAVGITDEGKMLMIMGTSTCHIALCKEKKEIGGICGIVKDGIVEGLYAAEAGQPCCGDHFNWFVKNSVPFEYKKEAEEKNISLHELLTEKAKRLSVGESGLLALDWWNGNRSTLDNSALKGMMLGLTLSTTPEEIYRALIEATAYGTRIILENYMENGIPVRELYACGGIAEKNDFIMQIYADVTNMPIKISATKHTVALGAAIAGAVAAGVENGGYKTVKDAAEKMSSVKEKVFSPILENTHKYNELFAEYKKLYYYFGSENKVMERL